MPIITPTRALAIVAFAIFLTGCGDVRSDCKNVTYTQPPRQPMSGMTSYRIQTSHFDEAGSFRSIQIPGLQQSTADDASLQIEFRSDGFHLSTEQREQQYKDQNGRIVTNYVYSHTAKMAVEMKVARGSDILVSKVLNGGGTYGPTENTRAVIDQIRQKTLNEVLGQANETLSSELGTKQAIANVRIWSNQEFEDFELAKANALRAVAAREQGDITESNAQWELAIPRWKAIVDNTDTGADGKPRYKDEHKAAAANNIAQALVWLNRLDEALPMAQKALALHGHDSYKPLPEFIKDLIVRRNANPGVFK